MILGDLFGAESPDPFVDAIEYHRWFEANKCPCCDGKGWRLHNTRLGNPIEHECQCCQGGGMRDGEWQCEGFHDEEF